MKTYTFKNGCCIICHSKNGRRIYTAIWCNEADEQIASADFTSWKEAKEAVLGEG